MKIGKPHRYVIEALVFLTLLIGTFVLLGEKMGGSNMLKTVMNTSWASPSSRAPCPN